MLTLRHVDEWRHVGALSAYSDGDARSIYEETIERHRVGLAISRASATVAALIFAIIAMIIAGILTFVMLSIVPDPKGDLWWVIPVAVIIMGPIVGMMTYSGFHQASIDALVEQELTPMIANQTICASCKYSLDGLPKNDDTIRCPECGHGTSTVPWSILDDLGIDRVGAVPSFRIRPRP